MMDWRERLRHVRAETGCGYTDVARALCMTSSDDNAILLLRKYCVGLDCACIGCYLTEDGENVCRGTFTRRLRWRQLWQEHTGQPMEPDPLTCRYETHGTACGQLVWTTGRCSRGHVYVDLRPDRKEGI